MSLLAIIEALRARSFSLNQLQSELRDIQMPTARGWDLLLKKLQDTSAFNAEDLLSWEESLTKIYINHLRYGTKAVVMFSIERKIALKLIDKMSVLDYTESSFQANYPLPLAINKLKRTSFNPTSTAFEAEDNESNVKRLISCAKRAVKTRESLMADALDSSVKTSLSDGGDIDELIVVRSKWIQSFDSVVIRPDEKRLEIHIDLSNPLHSDDLKKLIKTHTNKINKLLETITNNSIGEPINFFPCISKLYEEPDGYVHQLGHATGTASIKDEKMRGKYLDLRKELFHGKGLEAVGGSTNCYAIIKGWETDFDTTPYVTIAGRFSQAGMPDASVTHAIIDGCSCKQDFEMALSKLISSLP